MSGSALKDSHVQSLACTIAILRILHILTFSILTTLTDNYYYFHFTNEKLKQIDFELAQVYLETKESDSNPISLILESLPLTTVLYIRPAVN